MSDKKYLTLFELQCEFVLENAVVMVELPGYSQDFCATEGRNSFSFGEVSDTFCVRSKPSTHSMDRQNSE